MKSKKIIALFAGALAILPLAACQGGALGTKTVEPTSTVEPTGTVETTTATSKALSYAQYAAAQDGEEVTIEAYVTGKQSWWSNKATVYMQDDNGGYFVYELGCTQEQYNTDLAVGNKIQVTGVKGSYAGQAEVFGSQSGSEATWEKLSGTKTYTATKLNKLADMKTHPNMYVELDVTVASTPYVDPKRDNIYYDVTDGESVYTFCVETYLTAKTTDVYTTVAAFKKGDKVTVSGFAYTYYEPQLHTTGATNSGTNVFTKSAGVMTHEEFNNAALGTECTLEAFVVAKYAYSSWGNTTVYLTDAEGGYFFYRVPCTQAQYDTIKVGEKLKITGQKAEWQGEVEVDASQSGAEGTFEVIPGDKFLANPEDVSIHAAYPDELKEHNNELVSIVGLRVVSVTQPSAEGGDIYYEVAYTPLSEGGTSELYTFCVESDLCNKDTEVYKTALALQHGDLINVTGFMYIYGGPQLHTMKIEKQNA